jgi:pyrroline-5-carboxylate reductase
LKHLRIGFIGAGNMAGSIIGGLIEQGVPAENICASDPSEESLQRLATLAPVATSTENSDAVSGADVVILAVKPQVMALVTADIRDAVGAQGAMVISIAAGITLASLEAGLGASTPIVRCMPNTPALLRSGATALYANQAAAAEQRELAETILAAVGSVCWVNEEALLDAVTALSGSGPAYFFLFMEAMADAGQSLGLDPDTSRALAVQTGLGAALMAAQGDVELEELRRRVTSPGGTTAAALQSFEDADLRGTIRSAMHAAAARAAELARETG